MPVPLHTQTVVAFIWDFDRTLIPGNMQAPIFEEYGVDPSSFWGEVDGLVEAYARQGEVVQRDLAYLVHLLTYVESGVFEGLTNAKLAELGARLEPNPGMPEFMEATRRRVAEVPEFVHEGITVEHYVVSTGLRPMIEGSVFASHIDGIWANSLIERPVPQGYIEQMPVEEPPSAVTRLGYVTDNTAKTRAIFEINKGVNKNPSVDVNARMSEAQRRVPLENMVYIADGASDVPCFAILNKNGGKTLGVYVTEPRNNFRQVKQLQEQGRIQGLAEADFREGSAAYLWLMDSLEQIGYEIVENRRQAFREIQNPPGHV
ncbi:MAG: haloacid dehalogenase-like hydrolase [Acidimicrobiia bacterium]|nr:haloacid dehalogenase-like hydrolase [Acidimicrobiia bacterium]